jgi:F-type H+-transporting ATPase subunit c
MEGMELIAGALMVGFGAIGGAIGVGIVASKYMEGIARQPELQGYLLGQFFFMMAVVDALPIISLGLGLLQIFA